VTLLHPAFLGLLTLVPVVLLVRLRRGEPAAPLATAPLLAGLPVTWRVRLLPLPRLLQIAGLALAVVALARPVVRVALPVATTGIDIVLCLDVSSSMAARDLDADRTRLDVAKAAAARFVGARPADRIALVCFARYPDLRCPFTLDHEALARMLADVALVRADGPEDATGIGTATALAAKLLRDGAAKSRVVILLSDGEETVATAQTPAEIAPIHAAQLCKDLGIRLYAIAAGVPGGPAPDGRLAVDTSQVRRMTERCDGVYFQARDAAALSRVYERIDALEKAPTPDEQFRVEEKFLPFLVAAIGLVLAAGALRATVFEVIP
jgi:Ca-activated chloride channel homolog